MPNTRGQTGKQRTSLSHVNASILVTRIQSLLTLTNLSWKKIPRRQQRFQDLYQGVYHNYLVVRPDPSLHILFASTALQTAADLRQTPLLSHVSTSVNTLAGLQKAFAQGTPVTGRVVWKPAVRGVGINDTSSGSHSSWHSAAVGHALEASVAGQSQWLSATPLVGSDDPVGVWVIVIIKAPYGSAVGEMF
jgi:hypothetical protein